MNGMGCKVKRNTILNNLIKLKHGIYCFQETHTTTKIENDWSKNFRKYEFLFSHGSSNSRGVVTIISQMLEYKILKQSIDPNGRYVIIDIEIAGDTTYTIANIYAPTKNHEKDQVDFIRNIFSKIQEFSQTNIIICGDLNICLDPELDKITRNNTKTRIDSATYRQQLINLLESENMEDIWRTLNPNKKMSTWSRGDQRSRLDYFLISSHLANRQINCDILNAVHTDHNLILLFICLNEAKPVNKGFWKFNSNLLNDIEYVRIIKDVIYNTGKKYRKLSNKNKVWELTKLAIRNATIPYSIKKSKERNKIYKELQEEHNKLEKQFQDNEEINMELSNKLNVCKHEIEFIEKQRTKGMIVRSRMKWTEEGEKNTAFFLRMEKQNFLNKTITNLKKDTKLISDPVEILKTEKEFFEKLYCDDNTKYISLENFIDQSTLQKIDHDSKTAMDDVLCEKEILNSMKSLKNNKAPGTDGLTCEFYKFFWLDLKNLLLESYKYSLSIGELSCEQKRGIITLIPKKDKDRTNLSNWRPLTLLNTDYKILSKAIANRIKTHLKDIISEDQNGFIQGRYIGINIRKIEDILQFTCKNNLPGYIINLDFEKAFDTINWNVIFNSMQSLNFGNNIIKCVKTLYNNISSCVINNGLTSNWFFPKRGVRQGCPLSPYLFIIVAEMLNEN
jgi:exonuclease III